MIKRVKSKENEKKGRYAVYSLNQIYDTGWGFVLPTKPLNLYIYLKTFLNDTKKTCNPSQETILTNLKINKSNLVASIEFLNLLGLINVKNGNYIYNISNEYEMLDIPTLNSTILDRSFLLVLKKLLSERNQRYNETDKYKYKRGMLKLEEAIEKSSINNISITYETKMDTEYMFRKDGSRKSPKEKLESNRSAEKYAQDLAQSIYNIILSTSRHNDNYNDLVDIFLENEYSLGDYITPKEIEESLEEYEKLSEGYNIQANTQENIQVITDDETQSEEETSISEIEDKLFLEDKVEKPFSKFENLLKDIEELLIKFEVTEGQLESIIPILEEENLEHLEKVLSCLNILVDAKFKADDNDNYAWFICNNPNIKAAEAAVRGFNSRKRKVNKVPQSKRIEPTSREYYDQIFKN